MARDSISINGTRFSFNPGQTIFEVAEDNQIPIPSLCYLKGASPTGACRICVVEVAGCRCAGREKGPLYLATLGKPQDPYDLPLLWCGLPVVVACPG
jgi:NADH dehydrogenase/NADH:ubiquinone oxidoreductase subunit G